MMNNVYDIKCGKNLNFILPMKYRLKEIEKECRLKSAVIVHLHYPDTVAFYCEYLKMIPADMDIHITFSDEQVKEALLQSEISERENFRIIRKQNRGRDISSLLVACRGWIKNYEYLCFLHDKKEKRYEEMEDTRKWVRCLWENMIGSPEFIENVLWTFQENPELGVLVPPFFMGEHITTLYDKDIWYQDFLLTRELAERMRLQCDLTEKKEPITLGTVFWARVSALKKLFEINWTYEDFKEEPLGNDGTISHAIERILAYVAQDAGFDTGWLMTDRYMGEYFNEIQIILKKAFHRLKASLGIWRISELNHYEDGVQKMLGFVHRYKKIYVYGAGDWAKRCLIMFLGEAAVPDAFLVSDRHGNPESLLGIPVLQLSQVSLDEECGLIIAAADKYWNEIVSRINIEYPGFSNLYFILADSGQ